MNSAILLLPLLFIRYGILGWINKKALHKAAFFPPMQGAEIPMYWMYQASTLFLLVYPFFLAIKTSLPWLAAGLVIYVLGTLVFALSTLHFAKPGKNGFSENELYRVSRNPMYVAYFLYFAGCTLLTQSLLLFIALCIFQLSAHWVILSEERWCRKNFGQAYILYCQRVRRYL